MTSEPNLQPVVTNQSMVLFSSAEGVDGITFSNTVNTQVVGPVLSLAKIADKTSVSLGETLVYTLLARNSGNVPAQFTAVDYLPEGVSFIANSVIRDGVPLPGVSPADGIPFGIISPQSQVTVAFQVIVVSLPRSLELRNAATGRYSFSTPGGRAVQGEIRSNTVKVSLLSYQLSTLLTASTPTSFIGDTVTYTLLLRNEGTQTLGGISAVIPVPEEAVFIPGSVISGGVYSPEADPSTGIRLGILGIGAAAEISFRVRITTIPPEPVLTTRALVTYNADDHPEVTESNTVTVTIVQAGITASLKVDLYSATPGDNLRYGFTIRNSGNLAVDAVLTDALPADALFIWDSVTLDGVPQKGIRPGEGIPLGTLRAGAAVLVEFHVSIPAATDIRQVPVVQNQGIAQYTFTLPDGRNVRQNARSNNVITLLFAPIITIYMTGEPPIVEPGSFAEFAIHVTNSGNYPADVTVIRIVPQGTIIDPDVVTISAVTVPGTPYSGTVPLGTLEPGQTVHLTYMVKINIDFMGNALQGNSTALYLYTIDGRRYSGEARSNGYRLIIEEISE
ncbi:DUF11 domain-containing protein [Paenibacillus tianjinensis]|uniref:DUF11 domain-containing protein n=1 Tax=Paenibacillus tianjinensis TaxID=2810347 RepID=A0ABX7LF25_9BACL|nr:DUF11 domain-containing protein [Paenibacillus tianjinensis]QSF46566.1 DUF11 domain-containing protein [Paenibacillus tianjinensis]